MELPETRFEGSFGDDIRASLFLLDEKASFTNHGSYGTVPRPLVDVQSALLRRVEKHPDSWYRRDMKSHYYSACNAAAEFIGASKEEVVLVDNVTTAVNTVFRSIPLGYERGMLVTSFSYDTCAIAARAVCEYTGAKLHVLEIKLPIVSPESIVKMYRDYLESNGDVTFALVDHVTSPGAVVIPVREVVKVCRQFGVKVMIDGAHAPGQLPLDMKELDPDYYTGDLHKWMFCPRGCAVLYVKDGLQNSVFPLVVSHSHYSTFREHFLSWVTCDMIPFCMAPTAINFFNKTLGGLDAVRAYNTSLLSWATEMLCQRLSLTPLPIPPDMKAPYMSLMLLPPCLGPATPENELGLMSRLFERYNVQANICRVDNSLYCRISAQVYNVRIDYERLADALEQEIKLAKSE